jgi:hypothetical protein
MISWLGFDGALVALLSSLLSIGTHAVGIGSQIYQGNTGGRSMGVV